MKRFGLLKHPFKGSFDGVSICPVENHSEALKWFEQNSNRDGYFYPPQFATYAVDLDSGESTKKIDNSERPARVYQIPSSHQIEINNPVSIQNEPFTDEALIVYLLAYLYGTRLQLSDWKFEGRIPFKPVNNIYLTDETALDFLAHTYSWWGKLTESQRVKFVNILYVYNRAKSLEWDWDMFLNQYMVFDALYNFHCELYPPQKVPKLKERLNIMCNEYSVSNQELTNSIYTARTNLFHEAMWGQSSAIGFGCKDSNAHQLPYHLSRLNQRIICSITGYKNEFSTSSWWAFGTFLFNKKQ